MAHIAPVEIIPINMNWSETNRQVVMFLVWDLEDF